MPAAVGWMVVHALWVGTLVAGILAVVLSCLGDGRARLRYALAYGALVAMVVCPLAVVLAVLDPFTPAARQQVTSVVTAAMGFEGYMSWRAAGVRAAGVIWALGVMVVAARVLVEWRGVSRLRPAPLDRVDAAFAIDVVRLAGTLGVRRRVDVFRSRLAHVPMVFGLRTPTILLPERTAAVLGAPQVRAILAHELAHVGRHDYLANLVQIGLETVLWFHPAARWVSRRIRTEREYCCDDLALQAGTAPAVYARALAELEDARDGGRLVVAAASGTLLDRIQRIVGVPRPVLTPGRGALVLLAAMLVSAVWLAASMVVPPEIGLDARLRQRTPAPEAVVTPEGPTFPRTAR